MRVLKVVAEGITTSFRYPHFMQQIHPTFEMPPPATIYGHIASALGDWFDPQNVHFAYRFTFSEKVDDIEHIHMASTKPENWPKREGMKKAGWDYPISIGGSIAPFNRQLLFQPRLTLYINRPEWEDAFRSPHYPVLLGRSQDLFTYTNVSVVELEQAPHAYFEHTLLPYSTTQYTSRGYAIQMPRYLDYNNKRRPTFARYFVVHDRLDSREHFLWFGEKPEERYWVDPQSPGYKGASLGLAFLSFVGKEDETITIS
jgi:CRISPR-associated protein Cas5t